MEHFSFTIGVVIVSFNTRELLRACLDSLSRCTLPLKVVVVDNASSDGSSDMVRQNFPDLCLLEAGGNLGFARGNNLGLATLFNQKPKSPPYVLLLNPDTVVCPGAIESLAAFLGAHPRVGLVGPRLLNPNGSLQPAAFRFPTLNMTLLDLFPPGEALPGRLYGSWWQGRYWQEGGAKEQENRGTGEQRNRRTEEQENKEAREQENKSRKILWAFPIDHPLGACMLVRGETLAQVGGFDERYFMYSEEVELCWRIKQAGWAIWQVPEAQVVHHGGAATGQFRQRMFVELHRSRAQFVAHHYSLAHQRIHRAIVGAGMLRATLLAWRDYEAGRIDLAELRARLWAYGRVIRDTQC